MTIVITKPPVSKITNKYVIEYPDLENPDLVASIEISSKGDIIEIERSIRFAVAELEQNGITEVNIYWYSPQGQKQAVKLIPDKVLPKPQLLQEG